MSEDYIQEKLFELRRIQAAEIPLADPDAETVPPIPPLRYTEEELARAFLDIGQSWCVRELKRACLQVLKNREWDRSQR